MLGALARRRYSRETLWYVIGRNWIRLAACRTTCSQQVIGKLHNSLNKRLSQIILSVHIRHWMLHFNSLIYTIIIECPWREFCSIIQSYRLESMFRIIYFQSYDLRHKLSKCMVSSWQKTHMWLSCGCINQYHKMPEWTRQLFYWPTNISLNSFKEF
jgi:hypothetical protein